MCLLYCSVCTSRECSTCTIFPGIKNTDSHKENIKDVEDFVSNPNNKFPETKLSLSRGPLY